MDRPELVSEEELSKSIADVKKMAEGLNIEHPMVVIDTKDKDGSNPETIAVMLVVGKIWDETEAKNTIMRKLATKVYQQGKVPIAIHLISEAWISSRDKDDDSPIEMPRDDPNRREAIIVATVSLDGKFRLSTRPKNDRMVLWNTMDGGESELLSHFYRQYARHMIEDIDGGITKHPPSLN